MTFVFLLEPTPLLVGAVLGLALLWWLSTRKPRDLPPGPGPALPVLGHLHLLHKDPRAQFHAWRGRYGDVFSLYMGSRLVVVLSGYRALKDAFVNHADAFQDRPKSFLTDKLMEHRGVSGSSGSTWKEERQVTVGILRELKKVTTDKIQEELAHYISTLYSRLGEPLDLKDLLYTSMNNNISSILFGKRHNYDDPAFTKYIKSHETLFSILSAGQVVTFFPWLEHVPGDPCQTRAALACISLLESDFLRPQIEEHLACSTSGEKQPDFMHALIRGMHERQASGKPTTLDERSLIKMSQDLNFAGSETTMATLLWGVLFLMHRQDIQDKCYEEIVRVVGTERAPRMCDRPEMTYMEATVRETQRLGNVNPMALPRSVRKTIVFRGFTIPKGTIVLPFWESCLMDPECFADPSDFRPERFIGQDGEILRPEAFLPFGIGPRRCVGEPIAQTSLFLYLATMIQHFRFLPPEAGKLPSLKGVHVLTHLPERYKVLLEPRQR